MNLTEQKIKKFMNFNPFAPYGKPVRFFPEGEGEPGQEPSQDPPQGGEGEPTGGGEGNQPPESVPYERFQEVQQKAEQLEQNNQAMEQQLLLYQNNSLNQPQQQQNQQQQQPQQQQSQQQNDPLAEIDDDDVVEGRQVKKILQNAEQRIMGQLNQIQLQTQVPDLQQTLQQNLPKIINEDPQLGQAIQSRDTNRIALLALHRIAKGQVPGQNRQQQQQAQQAINKANRPGSPAQAGGNAQSQANKYASMSDEEFEKELQRIENT